MKRIVFGVCAALVVALGLVTVTAGDQDFELINRTGYTIDEVYVSAANDNRWGEDVMGRDVLKNGESVEIKFSRSEDSCVWDVKVVFDDKEEAVWEDFNLCRIEQITIRYDGKRPTATSR